MVNACSEAARTGQLTMKVVAAQLADPSKPASQAYELVQRRDEKSTGRFSASAVKIFIDGVLESQTAAVLQPYVVTGDCGILNWATPTSSSCEAGDSGVLHELVSRLDRHGLQVHMHAIGDRAVREGLDALAAARLANGPSNTRHPMAHLQLVSPADLPRFRALGVIANVQPFWMFPDRWFEENAEEVIGPERAGQLYPLRSIVRAGARIAAGSDWFVSSPNPFCAIPVGTAPTVPGASIRRPVDPDRARLPQDAAGRVHDRRRLRESPRARDRLAGGWQGGRLRHRRSQPPDCPRPADQRDTRPQDVRGW